MNILIIGGTGFIGQRLVKKLHESGETIFLLVRPSSLEKAKNLFSNLAGINYLKGDIDQTDLLSDVGQTEKVTHQIECVIHLAATYRLDISPSEAYLKNVIGTQNVLKFLSRLSKLQFFHYFSTYAVNQILEGSVQEDQLISGVSLFYDEYARSKNHAEHLVRKLAPKEIKTVIHRPGIIIGDSKTGERDKNDGPYYFFDFIEKTKKLNHLTKRIKVLPLPVMKESLMPVLPVDMLIDWCSQIILTPPQRPLSCYHLVPQNKIYTKEFLQSSIDLLHSPLKIICVPFEKAFPGVFKLLNLPPQLVFYMKQTASLDRSQLNRDYPHFIESDFKDYLPKIIEAFLRNKK
jgi:thioester reductase-like protein